jgi:hypothetical protein
MRLVHKGQVLKRKRERDHHSQAKFLPFPSLLGSLVIMVLGREDISQNSPEKRVK